jgi:putative ABC transport system permease protein
VFRRLKLRLRALFHRSDVGEEIELHIERLADELAAQGLSRRAARLAAVRQFGGTAQIQERSYDLFSFGLLEDLWRDIQYASRVLRRAPFFYGGAILVLALGIGANCAIFNLAYSVLLKPLPYDRPDRLVMLWDARKNPDGKWYNQVTTTGTVLWWRNNSAGVFSDLAVLKTWQGNLESQFDIVLPDRAERLRGSFVTPNFFSVLGVRAVLGRAFSPEDAASGRDDLVVLSYGLWQRVFGGDPGVVGRSVRLVSGMSKERVARLYTVAGVLPREFRFTYPVETEFWAMKTWKGVEATLPLATEFNGAVARLAPGVSVQAAQARMAIPPPAQFWSDGRRMPLADVTKVQPVADWVSGEARPSILLMFGVSLLLLILACATVGNALLVRVAERKRELAVRASLGASRGRLTGQLLTEGLVISLLGTVGGVIMAAALLPVFRSLAPAALPRADEMAVQLRLMALPAAVATLIAALAMLAPAIQGSRLDLAQAMKSSSGTVTAKRWRFALVALQSTIATSLLVGAAMLLISFWQLQHVDLGFDGNRVLTAEMRILETNRYSIQQVASFQRQLAQRVRALPGVLDAGIASAVPFRGVDFLWGISALSSKNSTWANARQVDPGYFRVMRIHLLRGRLLAESDTQSSERVAVLSESLARQLFPHEDAIGNRCKTPFDAVTVVGIVGDVRYEARDLDPRPALYMAAAQGPTELICVVARISDNAQMGADMLRSAIHQIDPTVPVMGITTIDQIVSESGAGRQFYTTVTVALAALALALTGTGLIVILTRSIAERRRELAIRCALAGRV